MTGNTTATRILTEEFYNRPTLEVTRGLLGKHLVRRFDDGTEIAWAIQEVEAYDGCDDRASHASRGVTPRTEVMYGAPGFFYVYFCYGIHWLLNVVTGPKGYPAAILIRGAGAISGPARLTKALSIDGSFNRRSATEGEGLWIEDRGLRVPAGEIARTPRVGVAYAGPVWSAKPYRFVWMTQAPESADGKTRRGATARRKSGR